MFLSLHSILAIGIILATFALIWMKRAPPALALIAANLLIFFLQLIAPLRVGILGASETALAVVPFDAVTGELALYGPGLWNLQPWAFVQSLTSMFLHADWRHLAMNMLALFLFGQPFAERVSPRRFLLLYVLTGLAAAAAQLVLEGQTPSILLGASGAIFGILGSFAARFPRQVVPVPIPVFIILFLRMPIWIGAVVYGAIQITYYLVEGAETNIAYFAHLGGLVAGFVLGPLLVRPALETRWRVDLTKFAPFADTPQAREVLASMQANHDEPEVFQAWLDRFFAHATCPTCKAKVAPRDRGHVVCTHGHRFDVRQQVKDAPRPPAV